MEYYLALKIQKIFLLYATTWINLGGHFTSESSQLKKTSQAISKVVRFLGMEMNGWLPEAERRVGNGEFCSIDTEFQFYTMKKL